jgi:hypothetical protein
MEQGTAARIKTLLQIDLNWDYLTQLAARQRVMPLLYWNLNHLCPEMVPRSVLSQLRGDFHANIQHNLHLMNELLTLLTCFEQQHIPVIAFKGPVLAVVAHGNLALRQFCDLDLLVAQQDVSMAQVLLRSLEFKLEHQLSWESHFVEMQRQISVDLHHQLSPHYFPLKLGFDDLWKRVEPISLAGTSVLSFRAEDLLLILCVNVAKDLWVNDARLSQICDIAELMRSHPQMDWPSVINLARRLGCYRILLMCLSLVSHLLGVSLAVEVYAAIAAEPMSRILAMQAEPQLLCLERPQILTNRQGLLFYWRVKERLWDKILYFIIPHEEDFKALQLPSRLSFLYYLIRPIRLGVKIFS